MAIVLYRDYKMMFGTTLQLNLIKTFGTDCSCNWFRNLEKKFQRPDLCGPLNSLLRVNLNVIWKQKIDQGRIWLTGHCSVGGVSESDFLPLVFCTAPGISLTPYSPAIYTFLVLGSWIFTYVKSGWTQRAKLLGKVLKTRYRYSEIDVSQKIRWKW